jgi:tetratricopeptide (TPR) repeat protein
MWSTIIFVLLVVIFLLSVLKISLDIKRKRPGGLVIKEGVLFLVVLIILVIVDIRFVREYRPSDKGAQPQEEESQITKKEEWVRQLLSQIRDYIGALSYTDKPQLEQILKQGLERNANKEYADALNIFRGALDVKLTDQEKLAFFVLMGNAEAHLQEYNSAINYYYQAERLCRDTGNDTALATVYSNLAVVHQLDDDLDGSLEHYFNLLEVFRKIDHSPGEKSALGSIGFIFQMKGEQDSASFYHKRSLEVMGTDLDLLAEAAEMNNLALIYKSAGQLDTALLLHQRALQLFHQAGDRKDEASVLSNIGLIYQETKELDLSLTYHLKAFEIDSSLGDMMGQAVDLTNIGSVLEQKGDWAEAKKIYQQAFGLFQKMDADDEIKFVAENIKRVSRKLDE